MEWRSDLLQRAEPRVCAWDIECTKLPLQFPNPEYDQVSPSAVGSIRMGSHADGCTRVGMQ